MIIRAQAELLESARWLTAVQVVEVLADLPRIGARRKVAKT